MVLAWILELFVFEFRMLCTCVKITELHDRTMVLHDFSRSGASDFDDFRIIVVYHFPQPFLNPFLIDFGVHFDV